MIGTLFEQAVLSGGLSMIPNRAANARASDAEKCGPYKPHRTHSVCIASLFGDAKKKTTDVKQRDTAHGQVLIAMRKTEARQQCHTAHVQRLPLH